MFSNRQRFYSNSFIKILTLILLSVLLSGCLGSGNTLKPSENGPDLNMESIVVFKLYGKSRNMKENYYVETVFQEIGTPNHFIRFPSNKKNEVFHIKAGKYYISLLAASDVMLNTGTENPQFDQTSSIPIMPIELKPGEVVYLGTLIANGMIHNSVTTRRDDIIDYEVRDESEVAKTELMEAYPTHAEKMQVRLFKVVE